MSRNFVDLSNRKELHLRIPHVFNTHALLRAGKHTLSTFTSQSLNYWLKQAVVLIEQTTTYIFASTLPSLTDGERAAGRVPVGERHHDVEGGQREHQVEQGPRVVHSVSFSVSRAWRDRYRLWLIQLCRQIVRQMDGHKNINTLQERQIIGQIDR